MQTSRSQFVKQEVDFAEYFVFHLVSWGKLGPSSLNGSECIEMAGKKIPMDTWQSN